MIRAVVFDLDHTLFDRHGTLRALVGALRERFCTNTALIDSQIADLWIYADDHYVYDGWKYIFDYLAENGVFAKIPSFDDYRTFVFENFAKTAVRFPFTLPMLYSLKEQGYAVGLITNGQHALQYKKLRLTGMMYVFDEIIVSGDVLIDKPDREIFNMMCEKLCVKPSETIYVGDNPTNDILGAKRAGMYAIWVRTTGVWPSDLTILPDETVENVSGVPQAVNKIEQLINDGKTN